MTAEYVTWVQLIGLIMLTNLVMETCENALSICRSISPMH
jgi:hypothetical protein